MNEFGEEKCQITSPEELLREILKDTDLAESRYILQTMGNVGHFKEIKDSIIASNQSWNC